MKKLFCSILFIVIAFMAGAQAFRVHGRITTTKMEPLAFVSIQTKQNTLGTSAKEDGTYELVLEQGQYDIVVSMVGYKTQIINLVVDKNYLQNFILEEDDTKGMEEVVIKVKAKDRAEDIIKSVIRNKDEIMAASGGYSSRVYIKAIQQDSFNISKGKRPKLDTAYNNNSDLENMAMTEISLRMDHGSDQQTKEERLGVKRSGEAQNLFFLSTTEGDFNFYKNLIKVPSISDIPFVSPISYSGLVAYKFKTIKTQRVGNHRIFTISVKPRQLSNATVEGEITIADSSWAILHTKFSFPPYHLPTYDFFQVEQDYTYVDGTAWMLSHQTFTYYSKAGRGKLSGRTSVTYNDYALHKEFPRRYFGAELSATAQEAYEKDSSFWEKVRTEPLTAKEIRFIRYKDSIFRISHTKEYLDSIDRVSNRVTWKKLIFFGQNVYQRDKERTWVLPPLVSIYNLFQFGGARINPSLFLYQTYPSKKNIRLWGNVSYGIRNHDVNGDLQIDKLYNPFLRGLYTIKVGREFQHIYSGDAWINLLKRSNFYLNNHVSFGNDFEVLNGLFLFTDMEVALRRSVSDYKTNPKVDSVLGGVFDNNVAIPFEPYNAVYGKVEIRYTIKQPYIREPKEKVIFTSKYPTLSVLWKKGIPDFLGSKINFDYLEFSVAQQINLGITGVMHYKLQTGSFITQKDLRPIDYKFQRQGDPWLFMNPDESFQALDSTFATFKRFYQAHLVHEFNGFFINRIPLLKKIQLREVAGAGFLFAPERNLKYIEAFAGIERVFKWPFNPLAKFKLGVYVVGSAANKLNNPIQFKVGLTTWDYRKNKWN
jgi:hypothetical protein